MQLLKRIFISFLLLQALFIQNSMCRAKQQEITMLFGHRYPPFYSVGTPKNASTLHGIFIEFLEEFQKAYPQYKIKYKCLPRARIKKNLAAGKADALALTNRMFENEAVNSKALYSIPLWTVTDHLVVLTDSNLEYSSPEDLKGKTLAVIHGNGYGLLDEHFKNGTINKVAVYKTKQQFGMLLKGRVDGAVCNYFTFPCLANRCSYDQKKFRLSKKPLYDFTLNILLLDHHKDLHSDLNEFIRSYDLPNPREVIKSHPEHYTPLWNQETCQSLADKQNNTE